MSDLVMMIIAKGVFAQMQFQYFSFLSLYHFFPLFIQFLSPESWFSVEQIG